MRWQVMLALLILAAPVAADRVVHSDRYEEAGRLLVELRPIFEALDAEVTWVAAVRGIGAERGDLQVAMRIDDHTAYINRVATHLDVPPRLIDSRTRVPLRFVGEAFGGTVTYLGNRVRIAGAGPETVMVYLDGAHPDDEGGVEPIPPLPMPGVGHWSFTANRELTDHELYAYRNSWILTLMRCEILARHGSTFEAEHVATYFRAQPWYHPRADFRMDMLNPIEARNYRTIEAHQIAQSGTLTNCPPDGRWSFTYLGTVTVARCAGKSNWDLTLMRFEIKARKGARSSHAAIQSYFAAQPWYVHLSHYRDSWLTPRERTNFSFILNYQRATFGTPATAPPP
jgi:hypothetical protein